MKTEPESTPFIDPESQNKIKTVRLTPTGHEYLSPGAALIAIFKREKYWCISNFLRGLFLFKLIIAAVCGFLCAAFELKAFKYHLVFLIICFTSVYLLVEVWCKIDPKKVFSNRFSPYIHRIVYVYMAYFVSYYTSIEAARYFMGQN